MDSSPELQNRKSTRYSLEFPNIPSFVKLPIKAEITQKQYTHDILKLHYLLKSDMWQELLQTGEPVKFSWNNDKSSHTWYGYVYMVVVETAAQREQKMDVVCIGSSFPLKQQVTRVYSNVTIPEVAAEIAKEHGFRFIGENHSTRFEQLVIAGESYWEWLISSAKRIGYGLIIDGMDLLFRPIDQLIDQVGNNVPVLAFEGTTFPRNTRWMERTLDYFRVTNADALEDDVERRSVKHVGGVDPLTAQIYTTTDNPTDVPTSLRKVVAPTLFDEYRTDSVVNTANAAETASHGLAELARFSNPARIKCQGDSRIRPFAPVYIGGTGPTTDGYWMVKESTHRFALIGDYQIDALIVTDGRGEVHHEIFKENRFGRQGYVNVEAVLATAHGNASAMDESSVRLITPSIPVKQSDRGSALTPSKWHKSTKWKRGNL